MTIIFVAELEAFQLTQMFEVFVEERENPQKAQTVMEGELLNHYIQCYLLKSVCV